MHKVVQRLKPQPAIVGSVELVELLVVVCCEEQNASVLAALARRECVEHVMQVSDIADGTMRHRDHKCVRRGKG